MNSHSIPEDRHGEAVITEAEASKVAIAALVGTALEWYDYFLYGTAAAIVFDRMFFVSESPTVATLAAFASFAVGFVARPVGAAVFGHYGDRMGRRNVLIVTVVLITIVTGIIGILPTYATIGIAAPLLLTILRLFQGFSAGGESSGALTIAIEYAPLEKRGWYGAFPQLGSPFGTLLSSGAFAAVTLLGPETFDAWAWRLPFLLAFVLLPIGVYMRRQIGESPLFEQQVHEQHREASVPIIEVFRKCLPQVLAGIAISLLGVGGFFLMTTFIISYGVHQLDVSYSVMLSATLVAAAVEIVILLAFGRLADRITPARVSMLGGVLTAIVAFPVFWLLDTRDPFAIIFAVTVGIACLSISYAVFGPLMGEMYPPRLRYTGLAIGYNLGGVVSGFIPFISAGLVAASGDRSWPAALLLLILALLTVIGAYAGGRMRIQDPDLAKRSDHISRAGHTGGP